MCYTSIAWNDPRFLDLGPSHHGAWLESQEHDPSQNAWSRGEEGKHAIGYWSRTNSWAESLVTW